MFLTFFFFFKIQPVTDLFYQACLFLGSVGTIILIIGHTFVLNPLRALFVVLARIPSYLLIEYHRGLLLDIHATENQVVNSNNDHTRAETIENSVSSSQRDSLRLRNRINNAQSPQEQEFQEFLNYQFIARRRQQRQQQLLSRTTPAAITTTLNSDIMSRPYVPNQTVVIPEACWNVIVNDMDVGFQDLNSIIMNYLVVEGYDKAAQAFARESKTSLEQAGITAPDEELLDTSALEDINLPSSQDHTPLSKVGADITPTQAVFKSARDRMDIKSLIYWGEIQQAIERINDIDPYFLDTYKDLHFELLRLELVELIRACNFPNTLAAGNSAMVDVQPGDIGPALEFATNHLARRAITAGKPEFLAELERTMALLCFPPKERLPPELAYLLDADLRKRVADQVNTLLLEKQGIPGESKLANLMRLWTWSEKMMEQANIEVPVFDKLGDAS